MYMGDTLLGLTSTMTNILGLLSLAELGITSAIVGVLYRYIYEDDREKIKDVISIFGYLYRIIGLIILAFGTIVSFFLPLIFKNENVSLLEIYLCFLTFLSTALIGYFISYRQTLFIADQKEYIVTIYTNIAMTVKQVVQIVILIIFHGSYIEWLLIELIFGISYGLIINLKVTRSYTWLKTSFKRGKSVIKEYGHLFKTMKQLIPHKIGAFVLFQTDNILIFAFSSLNLVTVYTNYLIIASRCSSFITSAFTGNIASIGNLIAEGKLESVRKLFSEYNAMFFFFGGIISVCLLYLTEPFIILWLGEEYLLEKTAFYLLIVNTYIIITRNAVGFFIGGFVIYKDVWAPIAEALINLVTSVIFGYLWGITGVLLGTTISQLCIIVVWKPYFLYKECLKQSVFQYWKVVIKYILYLFAVTVIIHLIVNSGLLFIYSNFFYWFINAIIIFLLSSIIYGTLMLLTDRGTKELSKRIHSIIVAKKKKVIK